MMLPLVLTMLLMYFLLMRPEQRKRKELEQMLANLKKNDRVVTIGGICGTVVGTTNDPRIVILRVDDSTGTKVRVLRSAISQVNAPDAGAADEKLSEG